MHGLTQFTLLLVVYRCIDHECVSCTPPQLPSLHLLRLSGRVLNVAFEFVRADRFWLHCLNVAATHIPDLHALVTMIGTVC